MELNGVSNNFKRNPSFSKKQNKGEANEVCEDWIGS